MGVHPAQHSAPQQFDRGRSLVASPLISSGAAASSRDGSDATAAPDPLDQGRRSDRCSPVWPASVVDWHACWPADTAPWHRTFDDGDYEDREGSSPGSTGISSGRKKIPDPLPSRQINPLPHRALTRARTSTGKKEEEISMKRSKKTAAEEDRICKPPLSPHF